MRTWLIIIGGLVALGILLDSIRRMRSSSRDSFNMDLQMQKGLREEDPLAELRSELPNGGARKVSGEVKIPDPKPTKSAAFLAKEGVKQGVKGAEKSTPNTSFDKSGHNKIKVEPKFSTSPSLEDTQKTRRTPTFEDPSLATTGKYSRVAVDLDQAVPMLMDADDHGEATFNDDRDPLMGSTSSALSRPRVAPRKTSLDAAAKDEQEVIAIHVLSRQPEGFIGAELLENILACGLRYGDMNIFHQYAAAPDDETALYSMANIVKPGVFDLNSMQSFQTPGVSFFMILPLKTSSQVSAMDVFDKMLTTAKRLALNLNGELKDDRRSVMTGQTIEHCRHRISEFSRKNFSRSGSFTTDN